MRLIIIRAAVVEMRILIVEKSRNSRLVFAVQARVAGADVVQSFLERVVRLQQQAMRIPATQLNLQGVVIGLTEVAEQIENSHVRVGKYLHRSCLALGHVAASQISY